jgi:hypothetical protein
VSQIVETDLLGVRRVIDMPPDDAFTFVAYGAGVNSTAMLCGWMERGLRPVDAVIFSDTGGERPSTYRHLDLVSDWLVSHGWPAIVRVHAVNSGGERKTLEADCEQYRRLPSLAYGWKTCSDKFKTAPQRKYLNNLAAAKERWDRGERVLKLVGYDADEPHRATTGDRQGEKYWYRYPLIEWGWGRKECIAAIERAGLPVPTKSACFFCPANTVDEIKQLRDEYPDLMARALAMEGSARLTSVKGLGRRFSWRDLIEGKPVPLFESEIACECYDGAGDDDLDARGMQAPSGNSTQRQSKGGGNAE